MEQGNETKLTKNNSFNFRAENFAQNLELEVKEELPVRTAF